MSGNSRPRCTPRTNRHGFRNAARRLQRRPCGQARRPISLLTRRRTVRRRWRGGARGRHALAFAAGQRTAAYRLILVVRATASPLRLPTFGEDGISNCRTPRSSGGWWGDRQLHLTTGGRSLFDRAEGAHDAVEKLVLAVTDADFDRTESEAVEIVAEAVGEHRVALQQVGQRTLRVACPRRDVP